MIKMSRPENISKINYYAIEGKNIRELTKNFENIILENCPNNDLRKQAIDTVTKARLLAIRSILENN